MTEGKKGLQPDIIRFEFLLIQKEKHWAKWIDVMELKKTKIAYENKEAQCWMQKKQVKGGGNCEIKGKKKKYAIA